MGADKSPPAKIISVSARWRLSARRAEAATATTRAHLVSSALWVHKHQQRLHELRGEGLHQEGLPAAILELRDRAWRWVCFSAFMCENEKKEPSDSHDEGKQYSAKYSAKSVSAALFRGGNTAQNRVYPTLFCNYMFPPERAPFCKLALKTGLKIMCCAF